MFMDHTWQTAYAAPIDAGKSDKKILYLTNTIDLDCTDDPAVNR
jgi:hypothetical protein